MYPRISTQKDSKFADAQKQSEGERMYAIAFDMDTDTLQKSYHTTSYQNAYTDIRRVLEKYGFTWQQGSVYFGGDSINAVTCVLAVMDLTRTYSWFSASIRDIRMMRIEEQNDLMPAVEQVLRDLPQKAAS
jgi:virulence-associated protein VapD